jgi:PAS domain S-box-containing protein
LKTKVLLFILFIILNGIVYLITEFNKVQRINHALDNNLHELVDNYEIVSYEQKLTSKLVYKSVSTSSIEILKDLKNNPTPTELKVIREKLFEQLEERYKILKQRGVFQLHFVLPDNTTLLRMHKPSKFGDDLSKIRYSYTYVNKEKKPIEGLESGKTIHAYRYVYPIFDTNGDYLCAMEVSFPSEYVQNRLTNINKLHTHYILNKKIFDSNVWNSKAKKDKYLQSAEHKDFMLTMTNHHTVQTCIVNNKKRIDPKTQKVIDKNIHLHKPFSVYTNHVQLEDKKHPLNQSLVNIDIISFYPIKTTNGNNLAWIVSYKENSFIEITLIGNTIIRFVMFFVFGAVVYLLYNFLKQKKKTQEYTQKLNNYVEVSSDFVWEVNEKGEYIYASEGVERILGFQAQELLGKTPFEFMEEVEKEKIFKQFKKILQNKEPIKNLINWNIAKNGKKVCFLTNGIRTYDENGVFTGYRGTDKDITKDMENQKKVQEAEQKLQFVTNNMHDMIYQMSLPDGKYEYVSSASLNIFGYEPQKWYDEPRLIEKLIHPDWKIFFQDEWEKLIDGEVPDSYEYQIVHKDGEERWIHQRNTIVRDKNNIPITIIGVVRDITESKLKDNILLEQSKMASLGEMMGNIAHQWRQPLNMISTNATGLLFQKEMGMLDESKWVNTLESINDNAQYLSKTIDTFKNFVKSDSLKERIDTTIQDEIKMAIRIEEATLKSNMITLDKKICENPLVVNLPEGELTQVIINIINNAKDALRENNPEENRNISINVYEASSNAIITIEDNAGGIPDNVLPHIFEPYFTTKHKSIGTGLGLHMCYQIVTKTFHGNIHVKNIQNGAKFFIELPL